MANSRVKVWLLAARPKTLSAAIAPVIIGSALAMADGGGHLLSAVAAMLGAILIQIGTNFTNDYSDFVKGVDTEDRLGPTRATQAGLVSPKSMKRATALVFLLAAMVGLYLIWRGGWPILIVGLSSILFGLMYTAGPYPLGYHGWGDIFVLIFFGPVAVGGTYYVQALDLRWSVVLLGLAPGFLSVAILTVNNLRDLENDRAAGKRTLAARFGRNFALMEYVICLIAASTMPLVLTVDYGWSAQTLMSCLVLFPALFLIVSIQKVTGRDLNGFIAKTGFLMLAFSALVSIGVLW